MPHRDEHGRFKKDPAPKKGTPKKGDNSKVKRPANPKILPWSSQRPKLKKG